MGKEYEEIEFYAGMTIETAFNDLIEHSKKTGKKTRADFNGKTLYSDKDTLDSAYLKITGKNKSDHDEERRKEHEEYLRKEKEHKDKIPELTKEWIQKGNEILDKQYQEKWAQCVPIRLGDLYHGMELKCCLDIVTILNSGMSLEDAKKEINEQGHSGMSFSLVCSMVKSFCKRGSEFVDYVK